MNNQKECELFIVELLFGHNDFIFQISGLNFLVFVSSITTIAVQNLGDSLMLHYFTKHLFLRTNIDITSFLLTITKRPSCVSVSLRPVCLVVARRL
jgi:hypothetical protein